MEDNNYIIAEIDIKETEINKEIRIINSYEELIKDLDTQHIKEENNYKNEDEIKIKCKIKINNEIVPFSYYKKFDKKGIYKIQYFFTEKMIKTDYMFANCFSLINNKFI